ncbi:MAG TPA: glycosyltransferase family 4 protein [Gemmatimonadales bacterium]|nr:glycosyltransferase family 4 protein [Gemmatimonadales bacterium]
MKILQVHNHYQHQGGEHVVFEAEARLLQDHGHEVLRFTRDNSTVGQLRQLQLVQRTLWNQEVFRELRALIRKTRPSVMHVHNTLPLISPAAYYAAQKEGVPVVQTLHNYRLVCPSGVLFRDGHVCELCVGRRIPWPGVVHACYRGSRAASAGVAAMLASHTVIGTWERQVNVFVALTEFARQKFMAGGIPEGKIMVKPNFVEGDDGRGSHAGGFALFVGRLSPEKGLETLLDAWSTIRDPRPLKIVGAGPLEAKLRARSEGGSVVHFLGTQPPLRVRELMRDAWILIVPSRCYEGALPLVVLEAFSAGLPVVASDLGSFSAGIEHERTGLLFRPGDSADLGRKVSWAGSNPEAMLAIGLQARRVYEESYTAGRNYDQLMAIYSAASLKPVAGS